MSRRCAFWIMVLFLGLTGIPMVYCILAWSPPEPLRFRFTHQASGQSRAGAGPLVSEVEVVNTCGVPILLHDGTLWMDYGGGSGRDSSSLGGTDAPPGTLLNSKSGGRTPFFAQLDVDATLHCWPSTPGGIGSRPSTSHGHRATYPNESVLIPSHGTRSIRVRVLEGTGQLPQEGELRVQYLWTSQPRHLTCRSLSWMRLHLPAILRQHVPRIIPDENTAAIQLTSASPSSR